MALIKSYTSPYGVTCPNAYHKVQASILYRPRSTSSGFIEKAQNSVAVFYDSTARNNGAQPIIEYWFDVVGSDCTTFYSMESLDSTNENQFSRTYEYMKTQTNLYGFDYTDATNA